MNEEKNKKQDIKEKKTEKTRVKNEKQMKEKKIELDKSIDPFETISFVLMTEKCIRMIESQNKLVFIVKRNADKKRVKTAVEQAFQSPVSKVTTSIDQKGRKRAYVKFLQPGAAGDIAIRLGII